MGLETAVYLASLNSNNPAFNDPKAQGDDHLRLIKASLQATFPDLAGRFNRIQDKAANYSPVPADNQSILRFTGAGPYTVSPSLVAGLGNGWAVMLVNLTPVNLTIAPTPPELVNSASTILIGAGTACWLICSGVAGNEFLTVLAMQNTATTQAVGNNSSFIATTAFVASAIAAAVSMSGLVQSNAAVDLVNDIQITKGQATDLSTNVSLILPASIVKRLDAVWAVGTNQGGLDTGVVANADYYLWLIKRIDTGVVDVLFSLSSTAPTMPANYTAKRLIGWVQRQGGVNLLFTALEIAGGGLELLWNAPQVDASLGSIITITRRLDAMRVPRNFATTAHLNIGIISSLNIAYRVYCPDQDDAIVSAIGAPGGNVWNPASFEPAVHQIHVRTDALGQIALRASAANNSWFVVFTQGFVWERRN